MSVAECVKVLKNTFLFRALRDKEIEDILLMEGVNRVTLNRGELLASSGETCNTLSIILFGAVNVYKHIEGSANLPVSKLSAGGVVGAVCMFSCNKEAPNDCVAAVDCIVLTIDEKTLANIFAKYPSVVFGYLEHLTERVRFLTKKIEGFVQNGVHGKVANYLLKNSVDGVVEIGSSMQALASALSISRASLYRVLNEMQSLGMIERDGKKIYISPKIEGKMEVKNETH